MLKSFVELKRTCYHQQFDTWQESIIASCQPLIDDGTIDSRYIDAIIACVHKFGPYIVLAPNIAMPHSTEGCEGVFGNAISFMKVEEPVVFQEGNPDKNATLFFVLASVNHDEHMKNMMQLATVLTNPQLVDDLLTVKNDEDLLKVAEKWSE